MLLILINVIFNSFLVGVFFQLAHSVILFFLQLAKVTNAFSKPFHPDFYYFCAFCVVSTFVVIGYSPIGGFLATLFSNAKRAKGTDLEYFSANLEKVLVPYNRSTGENLTSRDFNLLIQSEQTVNAMAIGKKTIVATSGFLQKEPELIQCVLAHELGHLHYGDSMVTIAIIAGCYPIRICYWINYIFMNMARFAAMIISWIPVIGLISNLFVLLMQLLCLPLIAINWLGNKIFDFMFLMNSRRAEYRADQFASDLNYGDSMIYFLEWIDSIPGMEKGNAFTQMFSSHPLTRKRIARLQKIKENGI